MSILVKESVPRYMPSGTHLVTVADITEVADLTDSEKVKLQVDLQTVGEIDGVQRYARFWTSPSLHAKGKLKPFSEAALGRKLTQEERREGFDVSALIGQTLRILVKETTSESGKLYARVVEFFSSEEK